MSPTDKLLLVFIHGFCGDDTTFGSFPEKICNDITKTITSVDVDKWIYDYNTKGDFSKAVKDFTDELIERINGDKKTAVILFGHSMGGLVAADAISVLKAASIPVLALLAYDTPFYGLSEGFIERVASMAVNNPLTDALSLAAKAISNNKWIVAAMVCGVAIAAYIFRDKAKEEIETLKNKIMEDVAWAKEYLEFASTLLKDQELGAR
jgi:pimeloyl-ACP methyl ester carboxylesterase